MHRPYSSNSGQILLIVLRGGDWGIEWLHTCPRSKSWQKAKPGWESKCKENLKPEIPSLSYWIDQIALGSSLWTWIPFLLGLELALPLDMESWATFGYLGGLSLSLIQHSSGSPPALSSWVGLYLRLICPQGGGSSCVTMWHFLFKGTMWYSSRTRVPLSEPRTLPHRHSHNPITSGVCQMGQETASDQAHPYS